MRALLIKLWKNELVQRVLLRVSVFALFIGVLASIFMSGSMPKDSPHEPVDLRNQYREYEAEKQQHPVADMPAMQKIADEIYGE